MVTHHRRVRDIMQLRTSVKLLIVLILHVLISMRMIMKKRFHHLSQ